MSLENDNRTCGCNNNMTQNTNMNNCKGDFSIAALNNNWVQSDMDDKFDTCNPCDIDNATREELLHHIKCYNFAIIELGLYLDTHPDDEKALCLHNKYCKIYKELTDKYQKVYGPLTIHFPCNKWRWIESPWPWEGGMN